MRNLIGWLYIWAIIVKEIIKLPFTCPVFGIPMLIAFLLVGFGSVGVVKGICVILGGLL